MKRPKAFATECVEGLLKLDNYSETDTFTIGQAIRVVRRVEKRRNARDARKRTSRPTERRGR